MKNLKYFLLLMMGFLMLNTGCEEDALADDSEITYLPTLNMFGEANVVLDCSATGYTDPGLEALESGQPINVETSIEGKYYGSHQVDQADDYVIGYQAYNKDSIPGAAFRSVFWPACNGDLVSQYCRYVQGQCRKKWFCGSNLPGFEVHFHQGYGQQCLSIV